MSACSSGGVLVRTISGFCSVPANVHARFDALNEAARAQVERRVELLEPFEADGTVAQDLEPAALEVVVAADRVDGADQPDRRAAGSFVAVRSPPSVTFSAPRPTGEPGVCRSLRLDDQIVRDGERQVHPQRIERLDGDRAGGRLRR